MTITKNILVIEDDVVDARAVSRLLREQSHSTETASNLREAKSKLRTGHFDAVVMDLGLPDSEGLDSLVDFQATAPDLPVVILTGNPDLRLGLRSVDMGAEDYLNKNELTGEALNRALDFAVQRHRHKEEIFGVLTGLKRSLAQARGDASTDPLTGIPNRRGLVEHLLQLSRAHPERQYMVALADVDEFKHVNDAHGHDIGDLVLKEIAGRLVHCLRAGDFVARVGGDEFLMVFDGLGRAEARQMGRRIIEHVSEGPVMGRNRRVETSVTLAMTEMQGADLKVDGMLGACHPLLSRGKDGGRKRLELSWGEDEEGAAPSVHPWAHEAEPRWIAIRDLRDGQEVGLRIAFGPDGDGLGAPRTGLHRARLEGRLPAATLDLLSRAEGWRRENCPDTLLSLDFEIDFLDGDSNGELLRLFPEPIRPRTLLFIDSKFDLDQHPGLLDKVQMLRKSGFLIGVRGLGTGSSILEHLALIRPDWIRVESAFTHNVARIMRKAERLAVLASMLAPLRSKVVAESCQPGDDEAVLLRMGFVAYESPLFGPPLPSGPSSSGKSRP